MQRHPTTGEPLICLRCNTLNSADAHVCEACGAPLIIPDDDFGIMARAGAHTTVGQVRTNNEDNVGVFAYNGVVIGLVADGMGGAAAGEVASQLTVDAVRTFFHQESDGEENSAVDLQALPEDELHTKLRDAILLANRSVFEAQKDTAKKGMGTTSTVALVRGNRVLLAHVGDSRAYLVAHIDGTIAQVTVDHSFVEALVASGHITRAQAKHHPMGHVLYRALGQGLDVDIDLYARTIRPGDRLVLCSDGLTRHISPEEIAEIVLQTPDPDEASRELITLVNARGAEDNATVVVIAVQPTDLPA
ncbi:MAG TPA: Stp1/IreP family PP2C-type Ser/Thr phosphatase [Aggregatilineales bacterium]|nr:Stp1/IreP family PP2C-type Ser/Thr phosphatase [Anaerolineales bacterium]HRE48014.1 Stp1/IreP family PP2C-type Ser/Thr phosphatase [Aggregatilineales bacterium]